MDITIYPTKLHGKIRAIPSKSAVHRLLICAAFADDQTHLICPDTNRDIEATADCLRSLGAGVDRTADGYVVKPVCNIPDNAVLNCCESGSTLRFMLPIVGALGVHATFLMEGRLPSRPLSPLWEEMDRMGCSLSRPTKNSIVCQGRLKPGKYSIAGNISSQYITGLLFAAALMPDSTEILIEGTLESKPYVDMTLDALSRFGVHPDGFRVSSSYPFTTPGEVSVEGDWSNAAFFLAAGSLGNDVEIAGIDTHSVQGDRAIADALLLLNKNCTLSAADTPDLVPIMAIVAGAKQGANFTNIRRLRLKESDRVQTVSDMLSALGADVLSDENTLTVHPASYHSCIIDAAGDHRIAMSAAIAATVADGPVTVLGAECVNKSYPGFWDTYKELGGKYEQYIR